jgi:hypothetical protein
VTPAGRLFVVLDALLFVAIGAGLVSGHMNGGHLPDRAVGVVFLLAAVGGSWLFAFRPRLLLTDEQLVVINPLRSWRIPLEQIGSVGTASYFGVTIEYFDGHVMRRVTAWAVQKANVSRWLNKTVRADRVAAEIRTASRRRRMPPDEVA